MLNADLQYFPCYNSFFTLIHFGEVDFQLNQPFVRSTFRNRMVLPSSTGNIELSVPLVGGRSVKLKYREVLIDYLTDWQRDHARTIDTIYGKSPFYFAYKDDVRRLYEQKFQHLADWNLACLNWILEKLKIKIRYDIDNQSFTHSVVDKWLPKTFQNDDLQLKIKYPQLFEDRIGFQSNVSILDLLFNVGPVGIKKLADQTKPH